MEHLARRIHAASSRAACSFVQASAAELPVEPSALMKTCAGLIQAAAGGTLLLTAVAMPAIAQDRFIETLAELQVGLEQSAAVRLTPELPYLSASGSARVDFPIASLPLEHHSRSCSWKWLWAR